MTNMIPQLYEAQLARSIVHNPFYMREGLLFTSKDRTNLLFYDHGRPCITQWDSVDLQPIPTEQQKQTITPYQFKVGYENGYNAIDGLHGLVARLFLASVGVRGPDSVWKLQDTGIGRVYERETGRQVLEF